MTSNLVDAKIANKIVVLRDVQVMIDRDIAELYGVEIKVLNQAVKRNAERFPKQFMFQLSLDEYRSVKESLWSQFVTIENIGDLRGHHGKYLPHAFTEQGVAMLSAVSHLKKWKILKL
ncbi:MAG: ORF6N domain-containing protein [Fibrobacteraceae bacterium]|nr:ORF6N domain-containing protein [Fibrobacteraceae bacterium]